MIMERGRELPRYCRKCLLSEIDEGSYFEKLGRYIRNLNPELKVPEETYRKRLDLCRDCDELISGMCRICGCYVELRAVMRKNSCPAVHPRWEKASDRPEGEEII